MSLSEALAVFLYLDRTNIPDRFSSELYRDAWAVIKARGEKTAAGYMKDGALVKT
jgi:hypothetical protein